METRIFELIQGVTDQVFAFALKRFDDRQEAQDLAQEILYQVVKSAPNLKDEAAFYGWLWRIANNVYNSQLRLKYKQVPQVNEDFANLTEANHGIPEKTHSFEGDIDSEQLGLIYRELALLSKNYREVMCEYYIKGQSCKRISEQLQMSEERVKQYLFKSRKRLKEGAQQIRTLGERSFNPSPFKIHFFGKGSNQSHTLFRKKAPGNILLECYYSPMDLEALSLEMGISVVYLEDEIQSLIAHDLLLPVKQDKYQSNLVIFTEVFETEFAQKQNGTMGALSSTLADFYQENLKVIRDHLDSRNQLSPNSLKWRFLSYTLYDILIETFLPQMIAKYPDLFNGMRGYRWGMESQYGDHPYDFGILGHHAPSGDALLLMNFFVLGDRHRSFTETENAQLLIKLSRETALEDYTEVEISQISAWAQVGIVAHKEGAKAPELNWMVVSPALRTQYRQVIEALSTEICAVTTHMCNETESLLKNHVPQGLQGDIKAISALKQVEGTLGMLMGHLAQDGWMQVPANHSDIVNLFVTLT